MFVNCFIPMAEAVVGYARARLAARIARKQVGTLPIPPQSASAGSRGRGETHGNSVADDSAAAAFHSRYEGSPSLLPYVVGGVVRFRARVQS